MEIVTRSPAGKLEWEVYYDLRYRILREPWNQPRGSERNEGDKTAKHFATYVGQNMVSIARADELPDKTIQIRFVATEHKMQGKGYGKIVMNAIHSFYENTEIKKVILHSRETSVPFYKHMGYSILESSYLLFGEIPHFLMVKYVKDEH